MNAKILSTHLEHRATVYLRQSTMRQVYEHRESTARQYDLRTRALALGWQSSQIDVVDDDLGQSGASTERREGFGRLAQDVAHGRTGAIFSLEVSRLARSSADWHQLLDLCGLADVVLVDEHTVYTPRDYNDRLLLGLKGTMSEAELYWMRLRLHGGQISKARRGEYSFLPPAGYEWDPATSRFRMDPDEQVQRAVRLVFDRFRLDGSAYAVVRYFKRQGLGLPVRSVTSRDLQWGPVRYSLVLSMLHNPIYAGVYAYGRHEHWQGLVNGQKCHQRRQAPMGEWKACLRDHHPGYLDWDEYMINQDKIRGNRTKSDAHEHGAAREGSALLQGLVLCGRCGHRMHVEYCGTSRRAIYQCRANVGANQCFVVPAKALDEAVAQLFLETVKPPEIELGLAVVHEAERQASDVDRQWKLQLERAAYEARLCERRYKAIDPENRVVARTLEREWNEKLEAIERLERERDEVRRREKLELTANDRTRILELSKNLPLVWNAQTTTHAERKNLLRMLVDQVTVSGVDIPCTMTRVQVLWRTGAVSDFTIERKNRYTGRITPSQATDFIEASFLNHGDEWIANELNRQQLRTGAGQPWTAARVQRVRSRQLWFQSARKRREATRPDGNGLYSTQAAATMIGVSPATILNWSRAGLLVAEERGRPGHPYRFRIDEPTLVRLRHEKQAIDQRREACSGKKAAQ